MQKYETVSKLSAIEFKRLTGVQKDIFAKMISVVRKAARGLLKSQVVVDKNSS